MEKRISLTSVPLEILFVFLHSTSDDEEDNNRDNSIHPSNVPPYAAGSKQQAATVFVKSVLMVGDIRSPTNKRKVRI